LIALGAGLLLGIAIAFAVEYLDDSTETSGQLLRQLGAGVTLMGVIPTARSSEPEVVSLSAPESETAEAYRSLRSVASSMGLQRGRCVEVTSTPGREGKTEALVNLAVLLARSGHRVIVVDCDLREPRVHTFFGLSNEIGLTSVLGGGAPLAESIQRVPSVDRLFVLSSGPVPANPLELLTSPRYSEVLGSLLVGGTLVLVDTPPLLPVTDAAVLAESPLVDAVVLVGSAKASTRKHLRHALDMLRESGTPQVGVVLNTEVTEASEGADQASGRMWPASAHRAESARQAAGPPKSKPIEQDTTLPGPRTKVSSVAAAPDTGSTQVTGRTSATINLTNESTPAEAASVDGAADAANGASTTQPTVLLEPQGERSSLP
jgi:capsular exopolysaccharide synthesis family protein